MQRACQRNHGGAVLIILFSQETTPASSAMPELPEMRGATSHFFYDDNPL